VSEGAARFPSAPPPASPFFAGIREYCLSFPGAYEDYPWGDTVYKIRAKLFATVGGMDGFGVTVKASPDDAEALTQMDGIERAAYIGRYGWITLSVRDEASLALARDLIAESYAIVNAKAPHPRKR
jgi:predicted DNA-binding protein (MmcQ/YjbR family)